MYTFAEKALARAAGITSARAGDVLDIQPDVVFSHDNSAAILRIFNQIGAPAVNRPERLAITLDHAAPAPTTAHAQNHADIRAFAAQHGIRLFEVGRGICHQVLSEEGIVLPGEVVMGADSHTPHFGWLGAFGMGIGRTEVAALWATGTLWIRVPETLQITLAGHIPMGVTAKDIALAILGRWTVEGAAYRAVEFAGDALASIPLDDRPVLPNMMSEFGAISAFMPPDQAVIDYVSARASRPFTPLYPDADAVYSAQSTLDVSTLEPLIALPDQPDRVVPVSQATGTPIQQAFVGTCTGGRYSDLATAAAVVRGRKLRARLIVIPASAQVLSRAVRSGVLQDLIDAGAALGTPGCGPCMGNHLGVPAPNEVTISAGSRNFKGRMGTAGAPVYLANAAVVAASAVAGQIVSPQDIIDGETFRAEGSA
ncbi:MAG: 3-isopropylmalate dehydratase large subunit [Anaerolineae bacterium]|nr:homoaconitate hydratase family protein [Chloroflexota bacterium]MBV6435270.1 Homoaconitase large subunit [Anaerolineae bacterium]MDL1916178.1 homoaconitate hydratase family protein [Anaerolineae bacterium CFX4]MBW7879308.1 3-isopropylmalate dehydratase large subunit [Anaerolineae bacterium]MCO6445083.1 3-isopropylmalate dehydratase large subunit [Anaerolineae bacterium]